MLWRSPAVLLAIPNLLSPADAAAMRAALDRADWVDGRATAGAQAGEVKRNRQLEQGSPLARELGERIFDALALNALFRSAALPLKVLPPLFNRYEPGDGFGTHVDNAIRGVPGTDLRLRTDLSATLFLSDPESYDGGELVIEDAYGAQAVKLPAGDLILYPAKSLHRVSPITRGTRTAGFFWIQSMVRDDGERSLLFDLDQSIQALSADQGLTHPEVIRLTGVYHNLVRRFADC
jgi:PKHD-type hydroxylase